MKHSNGEPRPGTADVSAESLARDARIADAVEQVVRAVHIDEPWRMRAYEDVPLPAAGLRMCPAPSDVIQVVRALEPEPGQSALVLVAGTGYVAAVLRAMGVSVDCWEPAPLPMARLRALEATAGIEVGRVLDEVPDDASLAYDRILVAAALPRTPRPVLGRMKPEARAVVPLIRDRGVQLTVYRRGERGLTRRDAGRVRVEPIVGRGILPLM